MDATETFCLELLENFIDGYIREHSAALIYWCHSLRNWDFHLGSDKKTIQTGNDEFGYTNPEWENRQCHQGICRGCQGNTAVSCGD